MFDRVLNTPLQNKNVCSRRSQPDVFYNKKGVLKNLSKFTGKRLSVLTYFSKSQYNIEVRSKNVHWNENDKSIYRQCCFNWDSGKANIFFQTKYTFFILKYVPMQEQ